ncbi:efflux RND transporter permease subunit [Variovorax sp. NFACC27]|uniref:efflux RND transporter permease subunit n=1 Tax=unclassified Variovorax TaxID=663243 RepID=UPI0008993B1F|nr:Multidrug efflux pump subunit AcrB [Variovorax sp. NFACC28]SEG98216.1 Multidrug efflux pump subunit AcrB [Variovorax sp. NFACC29]SFE05687.1 Multidrug efflux pump subunit AcrB [Variovorax sp. NFACC26]SFH13449.1 Multidrug efflux pump subunit AcrB [Variovorax sp. NFACC27]
MNFSSWSIRNPVPALLLFALLTVLGLIGFRQLQIQDFPDMDLPTVQIAATLEGAAPSQLETEVARKIEDKLASLSRLDHVTTTITDGSVSISVSFEIDKNGEEALSEVRNAVDSVRAELPSSMASPTVSKLTTAGSAFLTYTIASDKLDEQDLSWFVDNDVTKALLAVKGVASVARVGGLDREVHVDLDPTLMAGLGVTPSDVSGRLKSTQKESSGGQGDIGGQRQSTRMIATVGTPADIAAITVPLADGRYVRLDQIARISDARADPTTLAFIDGRPVIGFQVTRSRGYSDVGVANAVRTAVGSFGQAHPEVSIAEASNTVAPIEDNYEGSMHLLIEGALLAIVVVWWFLRDWRATFISATALPLSIIPTFGFMALAGYSLNTITLLSLSLVVGVLVDDAIVEIENIERHLRMGKTPYQAAMEAADEIGLAVIATTFTLVAVFLPTAFMSGIPGKFFRQFGVTASVAVLVSLLVARLLTPMMAAYLMKPVKAGAHGDADGPLMTRYLGWVRKTLSNRGAVVAATVFFFIATAGVATRLSTAFMPAQDKAQSVVTIKLAPGSTLEMTAAASRRAAELLGTLPEVRGVFISAGTATTSGGPVMSSSADLTSATLTVNLVPRGERQLKQSGVEAKMRELLQAIPGVRVSVGGGNSGEALQITLASDDPQALTRAAEQAEAQLRTLKGIGNVTSSAALQRPEIQVRPDSARAASLGVTSESLGDAVRLATYGDYSTVLPKLNLPQRQIAIRVRMDPALRGDLGTVANLRVPGSNGSVSLGSVAEVTLGSGPSQIDRLDRSRNITLTVELNGRAIGDVRLEAMQLPALRALPAGVRSVDQGDVQRMSELFQSFGTAMAIGIFCIYAVLVLLFHDFLQPGTILSALPLALVGALFSLWLTHQAFSMPVVIGVLMLMGIVTKNSILLVEYAILARRERGLGRFEALIDACHKRARPIVMTTIAMGAGMLPNALGLGAEPSFRQPMAIVVIGGLLTSTVLSLLVVPVVFTFVDDLLQVLRRAIARREPDVPARDSVTES